MNSSNRKFSIIIKLEIAAFFLVFIDRLYYLFLLIPLSPGERELLCPFYVESGWTLIELILLVGINIQILSPSKTKLSWVLKIALLLAILLETIIGSFAFLILSVIFMWNLFSKYPANYFNLYSSSKWQLFSWSLGIFIILILVNTYFPIFRY